VRIEHRPNNKPLRNFLTCHTKHSIEYALQLSGLSPSDRRRSLTSDCICATGSHELRLASSRPIAAVAVAEEPPRLSHKFAQGEVADAWLAECTVQKTLSYVITKRLMVHN